MSDSVNFDRAVAYYDETRGLPLQVSNAISDSLLRAVSPSPNAIFLEVGVGSGRIALPFVRRGFRLIGIDISRLMLARFSEHLRACHAALPVQADAVSMPFPDDSMDVVIAVHVMHLIPGWRAALREVVRVLKPSGSFCYATRHQRSPSSMNVKIRAQLRVLAAREGIVIRKPGANGDDEVRAELSRLGVVQLDETAPVTWCTQVRVREIVERLWHHVYEDTWSMTQDQHRCLMGSLEQWVLDTYHGEDVTEEQTNSFQWRLAQICQTTGPIPR